MGRLIKEKIRVLAIRLGVGKGPVNLLRLPKMKDKEISTRDGWNPNDNSQYLAEATLYQTHGRENEHNVA